MAHSHITTSGAPTQPEPRERTTVKLAPPLMQRVRVKAAIERTSMSRVVEDALIAFLKGWEPPRV